MKNKYFTNTSGDQLRPVILLLFVAVILPTVCLLWFMGQAVKNERLAVRQKLVDMYTKRAETFFGQYPDLYWQIARKHIASTETFLNTYPWLFAESFTDKRFAGFVIYDGNDNIIWPIMGSGEISSAEAENIFLRAFELEFVEPNIPQAIAEYKRISSLTDDDHIRFAADTAIVRCLNKSGKIPQAIELCYKLAYPVVKDRDNCPLAEQILRARVMLAKLYQKAGDERLFGHLRRSLGNSHYNNEKENPAMAFPSEARIWAMQRLLETAEQADLSKELANEIKKARETIEVEKLSALAAEMFLTGRAFDGWQEATFRRIESEQPLYGLWYDIGNKRVLALIKPEKMSEFWQIAADDMDDEMVFCRVLDNTGQIIAGQPEIWIGGKLSLGQRFLSQGLGKYFEGWKVEVYFRHGIFATAANRQQMVYLWTAILVIGTMVAVSGLAAKAILRQAQLNKLKNDFIATVTHELKTPLASMRVLVDTLLDGNYDQQKTANEYLQLISKENARLSRLIDNFLTFSRMERNKQAFDIIRCRGGDIAKDAAEAMRTKFANDNCKFKQVIGEGLPVVLADKDAMVTVLINLLDNAYKYSYDDKRIELKVFSENSFIYFSVKDNGVGMSRRQVKKVFDRFYQADSSLARQAEGTGLGLAIVKFIVDAHKGKIQVESKPGKGSEFRIFLPILRE